MEPILLPTIFPILPGNLIIDDMIMLAHKPIEDIVDWMRDYGLLARRMLCRCHAVMYQTKSSHYQDGYEWRCSPCRGRCSLREGSFFTPSHLTLPSLLKYYCSEEI